MLESALPCVNLIVAMAETLNIRGTLNGGRTAITGTPAWEEDFTLDPTGNWTNYQQKVSGSTTLNQDRTANNGNLLTGVTNLPSTGVTVSYYSGVYYDVPMPGTWNTSLYALLFDPWMRVTQMKGGTAVYAYDGRNWRISKTTGGTTRDYYYTQRWQIVEEQVAGATDRQFVWGKLGIDNLILRDRPGSSERLYACAGTISITALLNSSGTVEERYGYDAYGFTNFMNASFGSISSSGYAWETLYDSYRYDPETGLYLVRNRFYHPTLGIWMNLDPAGYNGGLNLYAYCGNSPVNCVDPFGLRSAWDRVGQFAGGVGTALFAGVGLFGLGATEVG